MKPQPAAASFQLIAGINHSKQDVLATQGVKEMHVQSTVSPQRAYLRTAFGSKPEPLSRSRGLLHYVVMDTEIGRVVFPVAYIHTGNGANLHEVSQYLAEVA